MRSEFARGTPALGVEIDEVDVIPDDAITAEAWDVCAGDAAFAARLAEEEQKEAFAAESADAALAARLAAEDRSAHAVSAGDAALAAKVLEANVHDRTLHREASVRLCRQLRENDLLELPGCADPVAAKARAFCAKVL